jgi:hypothetical protein
MRVETGSKWGGRTQIKFSQFSHGWKTEFEATGARGGGEREKSLHEGPVPCSDHRLRSPVWLDSDFGKKFGSQVKSRAPPRVATIGLCRSMILGGKEVYLRGSMEVALVVETASARAERIAVKNFMVRWELSWLTSYE